MSDSRATALVRSGLPAVLGWDGSVVDAAATAFAHALYAALARRLPVAEAAAAARRALLVGTGPGGGPNRDAEGLRDLEARLAAADAAPRRDWHLARVWLGPEGGGPVMGGTRKRSMLPPDHGHKQLLARKGDAALVVAEPAMFVGRRRDLQAALRALASGEQAGVLLHGMGRLGKSSLAARIASRRRDLRLAIVYGDYDALSVLEALDEALRDHAPARAALKAGREAVRRDQESLEQVLVDLLAGPCRQAVDGGSVLLLIDDLERVLEADPAGGRHRPVAAMAPVLRAVLRAFDPARSDSRLVLTSRFPFALVESDEDLVQRLHARQLASFGAGARQKLTLRQLTAAQGWFAPAALAERLPLLARAQAVARGNPGLQDVVADRVVLRPAVPVARVAAVLDAMEARLDPGASSEAETEVVRTLLQNLALDALLDGAGRAGRDLLRAVSLFAVPVPEVVVDELAAGQGGDRAHLRDLGLLDPFEDLVDPHRTALAVNGLAAARLAPLSDAEIASLAQRWAAVLFGAWGGEGGAGRWPVAVAVELTRLGLLAQDAAVVAACASLAVVGLGRGHRSAEAARQGWAAVDLIARSGRAPTLDLIANTAQVLGSVGDGEAATEMLSRGAALMARAGPGEGEPGARNRFLFEFGNRQALAGESEAALATFQDLLALLRTRGDEHQGAVARVRIADVLQARGDIDEALCIYRDDVLPVFLRLGDIRSVAVTQGQIADLLHARGDSDEALRIYRDEALPVFELLGDIRSIAITQGQIADVLQARGEANEALRINRDEVLPIVQRLGDIRTVAVTRCQIADVLQARGDTDEALRIYRDEALPDFHRLGDIHAVAVTLGRITDMLERQGHIDEALRIRNEEEVPVYRRLGDVRAVAVGRVQIADGLVARGDVDEALGIYRDEALPVFQRLGEVRLCAIAQAKIADVLLIRGDIDAALRIYRDEALPAFQQIGDIRAVTVTRVQIADVLQACDEVDEALRIYRDEVLPVFRRVGDIRSVEATQQRIEDVLRRRGSGE